MVNHEDKKSETTKERQVSQGKWALALIAGVLGLLLIAVAFTPAIMNSEWGQQKALERINANIPGRVTADRLTFSWWSGQQVQNVLVEDPNGIPVASVDYAKTDLTPLGLLLFSDDLGHVTIEGLRMDLERQDTGRTNLHEAFLLSPLVAEANFGSSADSSSNSSPLLSLGLPVYGTFDLIDASITLRGKEELPVTFDQVNGSLHASSANDSATFHLKGLSHKQNLEGDFVIDCALSGFGPDGRINFSPSSTGVPLPEGQGDIRIKAELEQVAVGIFDQLLTFNTPNLTGLLADALGETLSMHVESHLNRQGMEVEIQANSPNLEANLDTRMQDGRLVLASPGRVELRVTPELFEYIVPKSNTGQPILALQSDTEMELVLERMSLPTVLAQTDASPATLRFRLRVDQADLTDPQGSLGSVRTQGVSGVIERLEASQAYVVNLGGEVIHNERLATVRFGGKVEDPIDDSTPMHGDFSLTAKDLSTKLVDHVLQWDQFLSYSVGDNADLHVQATLEERDIHLNIRGGSDLISIPGVNLVTDKDHLRLQEPTQLHYQVTPTFVKQALNLNEQTVELAQDMPCLLTLESFSCPIPRFMGGKKSFSAKNVHIDAKAVVAPFELLRFGSPNGRASFSNSVLTFKGSSLGEGQFDATVDIAPETSSPLVKGLLGSLSTIQVEGRLRQQPDERVVLGDTRLSVQNELVDFRMVGHVNDENLLVLNTPATLRYSLKSDVLLGLGLIRPDTPQLAHNAPLELRVDSFAVDLDDLASGRLQMGGKGLLHNLSVVGDNQQLLAVIREMQLKWNYDGVERLASLHLTGRTRADDDQEEGSLNLEATVADWNYTQLLSLQGTAIQAEGSAQNLPTVLLEALTGQNDLVTLLGPRLSTRLSANLAAGGRNANSFEVRIESEGLFAQGSGNFTSSENFLTLKQPWQLDWTATPTRVEALKRKGWLAKNHPWKLTQPAVVSVRLDAFSLPRNPEALKDPGQLPWHTVAAAGTLDAKNVQIVDTEANQPSTLEVVSATFSTSDVRDNVRFAVSSKSAPQADQAPAQLDVNGMVQNLYQQGKWNSIDALTLSVEASGNQIALGELLQQPLRDFTVGKHLPALIGKTVSGTLRLDLTNGDGSLAANLQGSSGSFSLDGHVQGQVLELNKPVDLQLQVTPELRNGLLREIAPFMAAAVETEEPISLQIAPEGFELPLQTMNVEKIRVPHATLKLGKVLFSQASPLGTIVTMLNRGKAKQATFPVWFTPLHVSIQQGIVRLNRLDALIDDTYPVALWGKVDLKKDRVRMVIGVTAQALAAAYNLKNLDSNYVLQIPFKGTTAGADIDHAKATARITSLVAQSQGSPQGLIIGGVLDLIGGMDDGKVPPPSSQVPWETAEGSNGKQQLKQQIKDETRRGVQGLLDIFKK